MNVGIKKYNIEYLTQKAEAENLTISETVNRIIEWAQDYEQIQRNKENIPKIIKSIN